MEEFSKDLGKGDSSSSRRIIVSGIPIGGDWDDLENLLAASGTITSCQRVEEREEEVLALVTFESSEAAAEAVDAISGSEFQGSVLSAKLCKMEGNGGGRASGRGGGGVGRRGGGVGGRGGGMSGNGGGEFHRPNPSDMPLRMVVDARFVGAIIGQGGANIRDITRESKARCVVDVARGVRDQSGTMEKVINIYGMPENCSKACLKILDVVQREASKESEEEVEPELKLRAHNQLVGRLIGKGGVTIKKIMEDTGCTIFVSNISELTAYNLERSITIRGPLDQISIAEERISQKLRQCWENDMMNGPHMTFGGQHPLIGPNCLPPPGADPYGGGVPMNPNVGPVLGVPGLPNGGTLGVRGPQPLTEVVHMWVPNNIVGALIGTKGVHIRNVMRLTGAHIRIEGGSRSEEGRAEGGRQLDERQVTITGTDQQQYKAQFWIYQRVCEQGYHFFDEVRLCTELSVPTKLVGRIIGKGGQNVRELQRMTGAQVKIPEDAANDDSAETIVRVTGNFNASQAVQGRIRTLVQQFHMQGGNGGPVGGGERGPGLRVE